MNIIKKIEKAKNNQLNEGEQVLAAVTLQDAGAISKAAVSGGLGGLIGVFAGSKMQKKTDANTEGMQSSEMSQKIPTGMSVVGVTDTRVVAYNFDALSGKAKELQAELNRGDIQVESFEKGKLAGKLVLSFSDGGKRAFDLPKGNDLEEFKSVL